jgi:hypothetical protein
MGEFAPGEGRRERGDRMRKTVGTNGERHFWRGAPVVGIVPVIAILGFMNVFGKRSLLPADAMDG